MISSYRLVLSVMVVLVLHGRGVFVCSEDEFERGPPFDEGEYFEECNDDSIICENGDVIVRDPRFNCDFREECEDTPAPSPGFVTPEPTIDESKLFEEDMKNESRCPLDVNECGNIRDPSRDCDFIPCDDEEDGGGLACTDDVFECTDGTFVPRNPNNNCEFEPCPIVDAGDPMPIEDGETEFTGKPTVAPIDVTEGTGMPTVAPIDVTGSTTSEPSPSPSDADETSAAADAFSYTYCKTKVVVRRACFAFGALFLILAETIE